MESISVSPLASAARSVECVLYITYARAESARSPTASPINLPEPHDTSLMLPPIKFEQAPAPTRIEEQSTQNTENMSIAHRQYPTGRNESQWSEITLVRINKSTTLMSARQITTDPRYTVFAVGQPH